MKAPEYYKKSKYSTIKKQRHVATHLSQHVDGVTIHAILTAFKYFDRMGEKQYDGMSEIECLNKDAYKCADYLFLALTGEFLNEKINKNKESKKWNN